MCKQSLNCFPLFFVTDKGSKGDQGDRGPQGMRGRQGRPGPAIYFDSSEEVISIKGEKVNHTFECKT